MNTLHQKAEQAAEVAKLNAQYGRDAMQNKGGFWIRDDQLYMQIQAMSDDNGGTLWGAASLAGFESTVGTQCGGRLCHL